MLKIRIAGLTAELDNRYAYVADQCRGYTVSEEERSDLTARATEEQILRELIEPEKQSDYCHRIVQFGRDTCMARSPACEGCPLGDLCEHKKKQEKAKKKGP